jgi:hypothetical protein
MNIRTLAWKNLLRRKSRAVYAATTPVPYPEAGYGVLYVNPWMADNTPADFFEFPLDMAARNAALFVVCRSRQTQRVIDRLDRIFRLHDMFMLVPGTGEGDYEQRFPVRDQFMTALWFIKGDFAADDSDFTDRILQFNDDANLIDAIEALYPNTRDDRFDLFGSGKRDGWVLGEGEIAKAQNEDPYVRDEDDEDGKDECVSSEISEHVSAWVPRAKKGAFNVGLHAAATARSANR